MPFLLWLSTLAFSFAAVDGPTLTHVDQFYKNGAGSKLYQQCRDDWKRLRGLPIHTIKPIALEKILAAHPSASPSQLKRVYATFLALQEQIPNQNYIAWIDFKLPAAKPRLFIVDLRTGKISAHRTAHGRNSGAKGGVPDVFSNRPGSYRSSLGCSLASFYLNSAGQPLVDSHGRNKLILHGLESSNDQECLREVFMHPAAYVIGGGRSFGCPAVCPEEKNEIYSQLSGGGLICAYK